MTNSFTIPHSFQECQEVDKAKERYVLKEQEHFDVLADTTEKLIGAIKPLQQSPA
jgi:hypothetical protein